MDATKKGRPSLLTSGEAVFLYSLCGYSTREGAV